MSDVLKYLNSEKTKYSLDLLKEIQSSISERSFHLQGHIIYDLIELLDKEEVVYAEIGSYCGASASLALSNDRVSEVFCIDPLNLSSSHFKGSLSQEETLKKNISKVKTKAKSVIFKNFSSDEKVLKFFKNKKIDILYIDGDHTFSGVMSDWNNFKDSVAKGGFVVFDDYYDLVHSSGVKKAVDYIVSNNLHEGFEALGCPNNVHDIKFSRKNNLDKITSFVFMKKKEG